MTTEPESVPDRAALAAAAVLGLIFSITGALLLTAASVASQLIPSLPDWVTPAIGATLLAVGVPGLLYGLIGMLRRPRRRRVDPLATRIR
ncbi:MULTISPECIES: hypothetical protein [unclassified Leifsonia]|uniref:hypothetical protein n=1 Tax=unclassified Leifsonia TaxID=2663824 RepID=UPI0006F44A6A|nr:MULTISPECIES: hypothetical protein [unclassified Leifsonia]KQX06936.1 hypothetical protein ASC59_03720 [Leifsonia sp. Root1293]KRA11220.1 hypothetical protein ASD61_03720 [Leifsonia sp. Root60]